MASRRALPRRTTAPGSPRDRCHHPHELCGYFLIVADFIQWAKAKAFRSDRAWLGRGLAGRWALTITDLDRIRFGLLSSGFLILSALSMPDFDIDFCQDRRGEGDRLRPAALWAIRSREIIPSGTAAGRGVLARRPVRMQMPYGRSTS